MLFVLFSLAGDSPPASKRTKIPRKSKAVRCEAVLPEQKCSQTRKRPQRILCVFSRALTRYEGISARQNRVCPCQSTQTIPYRTTSPIAAAFGEVVRLGQECQKRSFIRLFSSGVFVGFSVRCFFCRQPAAHSKNRGEDSYRYVEFITASVNSSVVDGRYPKGESSSTRSSRPPRAAVWKNLLVSLFTVARQRRYSSAFPARGKRGPRRRRRPPPRSMPLPERKEHRADARR